MNKSKETDQDKLFREAVKLIFIDGLGLGSEQSTDDKIKLTNSLWGIVNKILKSEPQEEEISVENTEDIFRIGDYSVEKFQD